MYYNLKDYIAPFTLHVGPGKLPECLLCERKHVPGLIPGLIKITGSVNEPKSNDPGMIPGTHYPCIFWNLCVKEA